MVRTIGIRLLCSGTLVSILACQALAQSNGCAGYVSLPDPSRGPVYIFSHTPCPSSSGITTVTQVQSLADPRRPAITNSTDPLAFNGQPINFTKASVGSPCNSCRYTYAWFWGFGTPQAGATYPTQTLEWPKQYAMNASQQGYYFVGRTSQGANENLMSLGIYAWVVDGAWTVWGPSVEAGPPQWGYGGDPPHPLTTDLYVHVLNEADAKAVPNGVIVTLAKSNTASASTVNGSVLFRVREGETLITVSGSVNGVVYSGSKTVSVPAGTSLNVVIYVDGGGSVSNGGGGGSDLDAGFFESLFVPSDEAVNGAKRSMDDFVNWGPFVFLQGAVGSAEGGTMNLMNRFFGNFYWQGGHVVGLTGLSHVEGGPAGAYADPIDLETFTAWPGFTTVRTVLGFFPWAAFVGFLMKIFRPRQVV